jgi:hypothetical protein
MKKFLVAGLAAFMFSGCAKDKKDGDCRLIRFTSYSASGQTGQTVSHSYDGTGRISGIQVINNGITSTFSLTYTPDSVVSLSQGQRLTYYLNSSGLADSSHLIFLEPNPNGLGFRDFYTYDAAGFMTSHRNIFLQVYNGSVIRDTSMQTFTISNGNLTRLVDNSSDTRFFYTEKERKNNRLLPPFLNYDQGMPFLGKVSRNLLDHSEASTGQVAYSFQYQINGNGNVTRFSHSYTGTPLGFYEFSYNCSD